MNTSLYDLRTFYLLHSAFDTNDLSIKYRFKTSCVFLNSFLTLFISGSPQIAYKKYERFCVVKIEEIMFKQPLLYLNFMIILIDFRLLIKHKLA